MAGDEKLLDISLSASYWTKPSTNLPESTWLSDEYLYIGFDKPFDRAFLYILTKATDNKDSLTAEYWDGSLWQPLNLLDETFAYANSGFISWNKPFNWASSKFNPNPGIDATEDSKYFIRVRPSEPVEGSPILGGVGLLFCDDNDIAAVDSRLLEMTTADQRVQAYETAKNDIVSEIQNRDVYKEINCKDVLINGYDLDIEEMRPAAIYAALGELYSNCSVDKNDVWAQKAATYCKRHKEALELPRVSVDKDGDGTTDFDEAPQVITTRGIVR